MATICRRCSKAVGVGSTVLQVLTNGHCMWAVHKYLLLYATAVFLPSY